VLSLQAGKLDALGGVIARIDPFIVKLGQLLEMRGLAKYRLRRKSNRLRTTSLHGQTRPSRQDWRHCPL